MYLLYIGLSILQNGIIPQFPSEELMEEVFVTPEPSTCLLELRKGLQTFGLVTVCTVCHAVRLHIRKSISNETEI